MRDRVVFAVLFLGVLVLPYLQRPAVHAQQAGGGAVFAVTAPGQGQGQNVLYVIDSVGQRLMVYEHRAGGRLSLAAVRNMEYEMQFQQFPDDKAKKHDPTVRQIKDMLK